MQVLLILCVTISSYDSSVDQHCWVTDFDLLHIDIEIENSATGLNKVRHDSKA